MGQFDFSGYRVYQELRLKRLRKAVRLTDRSPTKLVFTTGRLKMDSERIKETIRKNAAEIVRLQSRIHETVRYRDESAKRRLEWKEACADFHTRYSNLAFPGGYAGALKRITAGDPNTMEMAICFLECRPYFFRSGYMFKDILRRCRRAPLSPKQTARLKTIEVKLADWKRRKADAKKQSGS